MPHIPLRWWHRMHCAVTVALHVSSFPPDSQHLSRWRRRKEGIKDGRKEGNVWCSCFPNWLKTHDLAKKVLAANWLRVIWREIAWVLILGFHALCWFVMTPEKNVLIWHWEIYDAHLLCTHYNLKPGQLKINISRICGYFYESLYRPILV